MKLRLLVTFLIGLIIHEHAYSQCTILEELINSNLSLDVKQQKIDSLVASLVRSDNVSLGNCYHDLGNKWYFLNWLKHEKQESLDKAIFFTLKAIEIKSNPPITDTISLKQSMYNHGYFENLNGNSYEATKIFKKIILLNGTDEVTLYALKDLGMIYLETGDFHKAIDRFNEIIEICKNVPEQWAFLLNTHILMADTYGTMDYLKYENTIYTQLQKADSIIRDKNRENSFEKNQVLLLEGNLLLRTGNYTDAISKYDKIIERSELFYPEELAVVYNNLGFCLLKKNDLKRAEKELRKSISLDHKYSNSYENLGDLLIKKQYFKEGITYYNKAITVLLGKSEFQKPTFEDLKLVDNKLSMLDHFVAKANGLITFYKQENNKKHLTEALKTFKLADKIVDFIRHESSEYQSKLYWRKQSSYLYMQAVKVCQLLNRPGDAFYFMERNKALLLLEDISNEEAKAIGQIPLEVAQKEFDLKRAIFLSENKLEEHINHLGIDSLAVLKRTIRELKYTYEKLVDSLNTTYPNYTKFKRKVNVLTLQQLQSNYIFENKVALHYILNEEEGYGLLTTANTTELFPLKDIPNFNKDIENLITALSNGFSDVDNLNVISNKLFKTLLPKNVYNKIKGKQLTIIPDYTLQQIPFEILVTNVEDLKYLIEDVQISYAYSYSLLDYNKKDKVKNNDMWLGVAPVTFTKLKLPELFFSKSEVNNIAEVYHGETFLNEKASKANFIKNANKHNVLHLATHADIGNESNPWIAFSDLKMYLKEIYATKTHVDMVVLSACNTSSGDLKRGEGIMSLARGFFYSGAKSVVSTLWSVADESGNTILINFYKNLKQGDSKSKALQKAKLDYLKNTQEEELKHPYYWAGFIVLGDNSPISEKPNSPWLAVGLVLLGTGVLIFGYKRIKAHREAA
ncbi:CHAT domain-containing protein [Tamlana sp. 2_MG-2023]|uniref:CHAT domain-containing protein n=1 Tax=unclassified Tamlana TaxID=2614803 RepID=UPI0026E4680D|nr:MULTISPECIES: CHAT domain-containing protein [unclassified Tamlana]MDO6761470.1 CHAT domain-containing protein [Tamlana sp. 2_MG-2023]MDO6792355.1 CHAT domain-containing protein [Tamlana sp. 1_MG-2023]